jgi:hypothetical protein
MNLWTVHLLVLAAVAAIFVPAFVVSCFEKRAVRMFEPGGEAVPWSPYMQAMANVAMAEGFLVHCTGRHTKYPDTLFAVLLLSPDRRVLALCGDGTMLGLRAQMTILISRFGDGALLITTDDVGVCELDPLTRRQSLMRADFRELFAKHTKAARQRIAPSPFPPDSDWSTVDRVYRERFDRIVARGLARYVGDDRERIRYTVWGSFRASILHGLATLHRPVMYLRQFKARKG